MMNVEEARNEQLKAIAIHEAKMKDEAATALSNMFNQIKNVYSDECIENSIRYAARNRRKVAELSSVNGLTGMITSVEGYGKEWYDDMARDFYAKVDNYLLTKGEELIKEGFEVKKSKNTLNYTQLPNIDYIDKLYIYW